MLVDKHDYHTFQPLLYQLATALVETAVVGHALRDLFHEQPNVAVKQATVTGIDLAGRRVQFAEMAPLEYDYLVVAAGAEVTFFGTDGAAEHAFPMYSSPTPFVSRSTSSVCGGRRTETRRWWTMERELCPLDLRFVELDRSIELAEGVRPASTARCGGA